MINDNGCPKFKIKEQWSMPLPFTGRWAFSWDGRIANLVIYKNGSSSIANAFQHPRIGQLKDIPYIPEILVTEKLPDTVEHAFIVIRNPTERVISYYNMLRIDMDVTMTFEEFWEWATIELQKEDCDPHLRPQSDFLIGLIPDTRIEYIKMENLSAYLTTLGLPNTKCHVLGSENIQIDKIFADKIEHVFSKDIIMYSGITHR